MCVHAWKFPENAKSLLLDQYLNRIFAFITHPKRKKKNTEREIFVDIQKNDIVQEISKAHQIFHLNEKYVFSCCKAI